MNKNKKQFPGADGRTINRKNQQGKRKEKTRKKKLADQTGTSNCR